MNILRRMMLETTNAVINALGRTSDVAKVLKRKSSAVSNWRRFPNFPPETYIAFKKLLEARGLVAPDYLWRMDPPPSDLESLNQGESA